MMFEPEIKAPSKLPDILRYFGQLFCSYPAVMIVGAPFFLLLSSIGLGGDHGFAGYKILVCLSVGPFVGRAVGRGLPELVSSGKWIWALPAMFVVPAIARDLLRATWWLPETLFATSSNEGLGVYIFSLPFFSALGYSIGMALVGRKLSGAVRLGLVLVFIALTAGAHEFERIRVEVWKSTKLVIDPQGVRFSRDPMMLCSAGEAQLLPRGTVVEAREHRNCGPGRLLEADEPRRPGMWDVERVRVLSGPSKGTEVWVLAYGVHGND